ncbi:peptidoglycan-binding protein [Glycomyces salinus]|uniref:peptidoglycan-binding protein n=1 Tax=Glycomyces salinus TaxID=980294 RepID=UPI0018ED3177|nr:peptidoglycan-binding protein [Glycomyces salinus]
MKKSVLTSVLSVIAAGTALAAFQIHVSADTEETSADEEPVPTATIERGSISATETWSGTLGFGAATTVETVVSGTVTRAPEVGARLHPGDALIHVDETPVTLLDGDLPMYRDLGPGDRGADVEQLERNLSELGYQGFTADDEYTWLTAEAVQRWQEDLGVERSGRVAHGAVVFVAGHRRVDRLHVQVGDSVRGGEAIVDLTGGDRVASLEIDVDERERAEPGTAVAVALPGGETIPGTVSAVRVVESESDDAPDAEPIAQIEVALDGDVPDDLLDAPVEVIVTVEERADVLLVPVSALLALSEGGYGLELLDGETGSIVSVTTGLFGDGMVEVSGAGLAEGDVVAVAGR